MRNPYSGGLARTPADSTSAPSITVPSGKMRVVYREVSRGEDGTYDPAPYS
ncbi:MAG: hypothetical protein Q4A71_07070 [Actinomycetaceae bacterium]|nr:hypothetical protein [Actinomycetaceae bacterium]